MAKPKAASRGGNGKAGKSPATIAPPALHRPDPAPPRGVPPIRGGKHYGDLILHPSRDHNWIGAPVFAKNRSELAEALPYFRISEGSTYIEDDIVRGFLLDNDNANAWAERQGYMDAEIVIAKIPPALPWRTTYSGHIHTATKRRAEAAVQNQHVAFSNNQMYGHPLVLILDRQWSDSMIDDNVEGHAILTRYVVLDYFIVTALWSEPSSLPGEPDVRMVRFEKLHLHIPSWWDFPAHTPPLDRPHDDSYQRFNQVCKQCGWNSFQIYLEDWFCHNELCVHFGCNQQGDVVTSRDLNYLPEFLKARIDRANFTGFAPKYDLAPNLLAVLAEDTQLTISGNRINRSSALLGSAIICTAPNCNQVCPRIFWHSWRCERCNAVYYYGPTQELYHRYAFAQPFGLAANGHPTIQIQCPDDYRMQATQLRPTYRMDRVFLHGDAFVTIITPTEEFRQNSNGPDDIFNELLKIAPTGELPLRRRRMYPYDRYSGRRTPYFNTMYGEQYDFSKFESIPQDQTPECMLKAESLLVSACDEEIPTYYDDKFNQASVECYFDNMLMPWHTEGDRELGSTIAFLSLGGDAELRIRLKQRVYENSNVSKVIRGSYNWRNLAEVKRLVQAGMDVDAAWERMDFYQGPDHPPEVVIPLLHGSVVIFQGKNFSKYFEHTIAGVDNTSGTLRFTVTARSIDAVRHAQVKARHPYSRQCGPKFSFHREHLTEPDIDEDDDDPDEDFGHDDDSDDSDDDDYHDYSTSGSFDPHWPGKLPRPIAAKNMNGSFVPVEMSLSGRAEVAILEASRNRKGRPMQSYADVDDSDSSDETFDPLVEKNKAAKAQEKDRKRQRRSRDAASSGRDRSRSPVVGGRGKTSGSKIRDRGPARGSQSAPSNTRKKNDDDDDDDDHADNNLDLSKLKAGLMDPANARVLAKKQQQQQQPHPPTLPIRGTVQGGGRTVGGSVVSVRRHQWSAQDMENLRQAGLRVSKGQSTWKAEMVNLPAGISARNASDRYCRNFKGKEATGNGKGKGNQAQSQTRNQNQNQNQNQGGGGGGRGSGGRGRGGAGAGAGAGAGGGSASSGGGTRTIGSTKNFFPPPPPSGGYL